MNTEPIDAIAARLRATGRYGSDAFEVATDVANALTDEVVVANAVQALKAEGWGEDHHDTPLAEIARTVLRSVAGE